MQRLFLLCAVLFLAAPASAENVLRWASQGDAFTMDPHAQNEGQTHTFSLQVEEQLVARKPDLTKTPALAVSWTLVNPTTWEFKLRPNVKFHDGRPFTSDDVVFSFKRALLPTSDMRDIIGMISDVVAVDPLTVRIITKGPDPILLDEVANIFIMSRGWAKEHGVEVPHESGKESYAVRHKNGTGPFKLELREPDVRSVMVKNPDWWGLKDQPHNVDRIIYTPIKNPATRVAALLSGELDFVLDPPVQDLARIESSGTFTVQKTASPWTIFLGMNAGGQELASSSVKGKNPFADIRVRKAVNMAIDRKGIAQRIMRGLAEPAGNLVPPGVYGYDASLDVPMAFDAEGAKKLMAEAGYPNGFDLRLDCPNDRYLNDEQVCQAIVGMLARVGVKATLDPKPRTLHFPKVQNKKTDFYLFGWGTDTTDAHNHLAFLGLPTSVWNATGYSDPPLFDMINAMATEVDKAKRDTLIRDATIRLRDAHSYAPLYHPMLAWATRKNLTLPVAPDSFPRFSYARFK
ncbi:MAG: ABC transporter substrate-binding protein [Rhodospirillaceae bacterium]|nr:ABC transporter substrate-binding protein [Rhodospirillaceae bacterium]